MPAQLIQGRYEAPGDLRSRRAMPGAAMEQLIDPVCGMRVAPDAPLKAEHASETYRLQLLERTSGR